MPLDAAAPADRAPMTEEQVRAAHSALLCARAYKPSPVIFDYALRDLGREPVDILHVAQGFEYDIVPAHALGWERVWINRYGKTGDPAHGPYHELPDLSGLPRLLGV